MHKLLEFRTTYLRAIAKAWTDPEFRAALMSRPIEVLDEKFGYVWPWKMECALEIKDAAGRFEWNGSEWIYLGDLLESLTCYLPLDPVVITGNRSIALADYYQQRPALFSDKGIGMQDPGRDSMPQGDPILDASVISDKDSAILDDLKDLENLQKRRGLSVRGPSGSGERPPRLMPADEEFTAFQVALIAAMAKAWIDPLFKNRLLNNATDALTAIRNYKVPWDLTIQVKEDTWSKWNVEKSCWVFDPQRPNAVLKLFLPPKPTDISSEPLALAMYNATGAEYPFTCCPC